MKTWVRKYTKAQLKVPASIFWLQNVRESTRRQSIGWTIRKRHDL